MNDNRIYRLPCPYCKNLINVSELLPNNTRVSFFSDFILVDGHFEKDRCFASITGMKVKSKKTKKEDEPNFVRHNPIERF